MCFRKLNQKAGGMNVHSWRRWWAFCSRQHSLSTNIGDNFNLVQRFLQDVLTGERQDSRPRPLVYVSSHINHANKHTQRLLSTHSFKNSVPLYCSSHPHQLVRGGGTEKARSWHFAQSVTHGLRDARRSQSPSLTCHELTQQHLNLSAPATKPSATHSWLHRRDPGTCTASPPFCKP